VRPIALAAGILGLSLGGVACVACVGPFSEMREDQYSNAAAARAADPSGWIPGILPEDAKQIHEVHAGDATRTWGCFSTSRSEEVRSLLSRLHATELSGPIGNRPAEVFRDFSWWPESMSAGAVEAWEFHEAPRCSACASALVRVGIDSSTGTVCFHRT
jgi:hypothetical protein